MNNAILGTRSWKRSTSSKGSKVALNEAKWNMLVGKCCPDKRGVSKHALLVCTYTSTDSPRHNLGSIIQLDENRLSVASASVCAILLPECAP